MTPNNDHVICPACTHQFRAIPVNVQTTLLSAGFEPPFTEPKVEPAATTGIEQIAGAISKHISTSLYQREVLAAAQYIYHRYCTVPQKCKPLTQQQVVDGFCVTPHNTQYVGVFDSGVRFAEAAHGIKDQA